MRSIVQVQQWIFTHYLCIFLSYWNVQRTLLHGKKKVWTLESITRQRSVNFMNYYIKSYVVIVEREVEVQLGLRVMNSNEKYNKNKSLKCKTDESRVFFLVIQNVKVYKTIYTKHHPLPHLSQGAYCHFH